MTNAEVVFLANSNWTLKSGNVTNPDGNPVSSAVLFTSVVVVVDNARMVANTVSTL